MSLVRGLAVAVLVLAVHVASASAVYTTAIDHSFGNDGTAIVAAVPSTTNVASDLAVQGDGKVVVAGYATDAPDDRSTPSKVVVARLNADGTLDAGFGTGGRVVLADLGAFDPPADPGGASRRVALRLQADGALLVLGNGLVRLGRDGQTDPLFGIAGRGAIPAGFAPRGMTIDKVGRIVVLGMQGEADPTAAVLRLTSDGTADAAFGNGGLVSVPRVTDDSGQGVASLDYRDITTTDDGRVVIAGGVGDGKAALAVIGPNGDLDTTFGGDGQRVAALLAIGPGTLAVTSSNEASAASFICLSHAGCRPVVVKIGLQDAKDANAGGCGCGGVGALLRAPSGGLIWASAAQIARFDDPGEAPGPIEGPGRVSDDASDFDHATLGSAYLDRPRGKLAGVTAVLPDGKLLIAGVGPQDHGQAGLLVQRLYGFSTPPAPRVEVAKRGPIPTTTLGAAVPLHCATPVSCRGVAILRDTRSELGRGAFAIGPDASATALIPLRRAARSAVRLTITIKYGATIDRAVTLATPTSTLPARGRFGPLVPMASAVTGFATDGRRYVAWTQPGSVQVLDTQKQRRYGVAVPRDCTLSSWPISFPMVLTLCRDDDFLFRTGQLTDVSTGATRSLELSETSTVGGTWVGPLNRPADCPSDQECQLYLNWHTGAVRTIHDPVEKVPVRDLDTRDLRPVRRCAPYEIGNRREYQRPDILIVKPGSLAVGRCGRAKPTVLDRAEYLSLSRAQVGSGLVTWSRNGKAGADVYDITTGRSRHFAVPDALATYGERTSTAPTRTAVIIAAASHEACSAGGCNGDAYTLYQARLRR